MMEPKISRFAMCLLAVAGLFFCTGSVELACGAQRFSSCLDRSYYTTEAAAVVVCRVDESAFETRDRQIVVKDAGGRTLATHPKPCDGARLTFPISELSVGDHVITVSVSEQDDRPVVSQGLNLVKRVPKPGCEWKIDRINRIFLRNGEPFFPHGILMRGSEEDFAQAA